MNPARSSFCVDVLARGLVLLFRSSLVLCANCGQRHRDIFQCGAVLALGRDVGVAPKSPDVLDAEALQIGDGAEVVGGDVVDTVAVVGQGELAAELEPFLYIPPSAYEWTLFLCISKNVPLQCCDPGTARRGPCAAPRCCTRATRPAQPPPSGSAGHAPRRPSTGGYRASAPHSAGG